MPFDPIMGVGYTPAASTGLSEEGFDLSTGEAFTSTNKLYGPIELTSKRRLVGIRVFLKQNNSSTLDYPVMTIEINGQPLVSYQLSNAPSGTSIDYSGLLVQETIPMNMELIGSNTLAVRFTQNSAINYGAFWIVKAQLIPL